MPQDMTRQQLIERVRTSGLTGLSGSTFPAADKLQTFADHSADRRYLLVNSVECDPGLIHDGWILNTCAEQVQRGIQVLDHCFHFRKMVVASKKEPEVSIPGVQMVRVANRYPMGYEKILAETVFGIHMAKDDIPTENGILIMNIQTVLAIGELMFTKTASDSRYLTAANLETGEAAVVRAKYGEMAQTILERVFPDAAGRDIYIGGGAMLCHPATPGERISAGTGFVAYGSMPDYEAAQNCKGCGRCSSKCPAKIKVHKIVALAERGAVDGYEPYQPQRCIGCGACTYMCSAGKDVRQIVANINSL